MNGADNLRPSDPPRETPVQPPVADYAINKNEVHVAGRLFADPEIKTIGKDTVARFYLEVRKRAPDVQNPRETFFLPVTLWGEAVENSKMFLRQWNVVQVEGRLRTHEYKMADGERHSVLRLDAYKVQALARDCWDQGREIGD